MKIIDKSKCKGREQMIENEVEILRKVRHPNIIRLLAEFDTPTELYLIMELEASTCITVTTHYSYQYDSFSMS